MVLISRSITVRRFFSIVSFVSLDYKTLLRSDSVLLIPKKSLKGKILNSQEMVGEDLHRSSDNTDL